MNAATQKSQPAIDVNAMGIREFEQAIKDGTMTPLSVAEVLEARIVKRRAANKPPIAKVVAFYNELARQLGRQTFPEPVYAKTTAPANDSGALPADPVKLADLVFSTVGAAGAAAVIGALTARIAKAK
jgi:hypothetical protein